MNTPALDSLKITIEQFDGETLLSETTHTVHELPNADANNLNMLLVETIVGLFRNISEEKARIGAKTGESFPFPV